VPDNSLPLGFDELKSELPDIKGTDGTEKWATCSKPFIHFCRWLETRFLMALSEGVSDFVINLRNKTILNAKVT